MYDRLTKSEKIAQLQSDISYWNRKLARVRSDKSEHACIAAIAEAKDELAAMEPAAKCSECGTWYASNEEAAQCCTLAGAQSERTRLARAVARYRAAIKPEPTDNATPVVGNNGAARITVHAPFSPGSEVYALCGAIIRDTSPGVIATDLRDVTCKLCAKRVKRTEIPGPLPAIHRDAEGK